MGNLIYVEIIYSRIHCSHLWLTTCLPLTSQELTTTQTTHHVSEKSKIAWTVKLKFLELMLKVVKELNVMERLMSNGVLSMLQLDGSRSPQLLASGTKNLLLISHL